MQGPFYFWLDLKRFKIVLTTICFKTILLAINGIYICDNIAYLLYFKFKLSYQKTLFLLCDLNTKK